MSCSLQQPHLADVGDTLNSKEMFPIKVTARIIIFLIAFVQYQVIHQKDGQKTKCPDTLI